MKLWKDIKGYEGLYQVSDCGDVKSLKRSVINVRGNLQNYPECLLRKELIKRDHTTYCRVTLSKNHSVKRHQVHRLVAQAFIPGGNINQVCVNHKDNNGQHNVRSNLEWCTHTENMLHAQKQGRLFTSQSNAGKAAGKKALENLSFEFAVLSGTTVNAWSIGAYAEYRCKKHYIKCTCICGKNQNIEVGRIRRAEITACKKCVFNDLWR